MTGLYLFQCLIVVDVLRPIVKIDEDLRVAVRQESIDRVFRVIAFVIDKMIDEAAQRKPRDVPFKNHGCV